VVVAVLPVEAAVVVGVAAVVGLDVFDELEHAAADSASATLTAANLLIDTVFMLDPFQP
jgi:hypothetical protein